MDLELNNNLAKLNKKLAAVLNRKGVLQRYMKKGSKRASTVVCLMNVHPEGLGKNKGAAALAAAPQRDFSYRTRRITYAIREP